MPLIFRSLEKDRAQWFWALAAITGENPVPVEDVGRVNRMAERWLAWGKAHGFLG